MFVSPSGRQVRSDRTVTRRRVLAGGAALIAAPALGQVSASRAQSASLGGLMVDRATRWVAMLDETQREAALFDFDSPTRRAWDYMLGAVFAPGVPLEFMTNAQKDAALDLLSVGLSEDGMQTANNIMLQQDILRDEWGKGSPDRNSDRFSLMIFGTPSVSETWGWRWEGHHLSLSTTLIGDRIVSVTPSSFSSEPNTVPSGPHKGLVVLPDEETLGRALYDSLSPSNARQALIRDRSFGNILTVAGQEDRISDREGLALGDLPQAQVDIALRLVEVYSIDHLPAPLADEQRARVKEGDPMAIRFAWAGADPEGESIYYRLHGDTFLIEFATVPNQPLHHHTIRHDRDRNLGDHV
ncbi:MAG: DUF3500 domain-containing protein [Pseudomonadota bacterium]